MTELKPCPFCGGEAKFLLKTYTAGGTTRGWEFGIYCTACDVTTPKTNYNLEIQLNDYGDIEVVVDERHSAIKAWNRRAHENR